MSRIGKKPIEIPSGVEVKMDGLHVTVKGPKGTLEYDVHPLVQVAEGEEEGVKMLNVTVKNPKETFERSIWGTVRSNLQNLITGVTEGFSKQLEVVGVGYKVNMKGKNLVLDVGYSHSVDVEVPEGVNVSVDKNTITVEGVDKHAVGDLAANIRKIRKPEPYKGKGIKYVDEVIRRKAGKAAKAAE